MNSVKHTQVARRKLMNIQTRAKNMHQTTTETKINNAFLLDYISTLLKRFNDFCLTKYRADVTTTTSKNSNGVSLNYAHFMLAHASGNL